MALNYSKQNIICGEERIILANYFPTTAAASRIDTNFFKGI